MIFVISLIWACTFTIFSQSQETITKRKEFTMNFCFLFLWMNYCSEFAYGFNCPNFLALAFISSFNFSWKDLRCQSSLRKRIEQVNWNSKMLLEWPAILCDRWRRWLFCALLIKLRCQKKGFTRWRHFLPEETWEWPKIVLSRTRKFSVKKRTFGVPFMQLLEVSQLNVHLIYVKVSWNSFSFIFKCNV